MRRCWSCNVLGAVRIIGATICEASAPLLLVAIGRLVVIGAVSEFTVAALTMSGWLVALSAAKLGFFQSEGDSVASRSCGAGVWGFWGTGVSEVPSSCCGVVCKASGSLLLLLSLTSRELAAGTAVGFDSGEKLEAGFSVVSAYFASCTGAGLVSETAVGSAATARPTTMEATATPRVLMV